MRSASNENRIDPPKLKGSSAQVVSGAQAMSLMLSYLLKGRPTIAVKWLLFVVLCYLGRTGRKNNTQSSRYSVSGRNRTWCRASIDSGACYSPVTAVPHVSPIAVL